MRIIAPLPSKWVGKILPIFFIIAVLLNCSVALAKDSDSIEVKFSPNQGATKAIVKLIGEAKKSVRVAAYSFTSKDIATALLAAHKRGVDVKAVMDKSNTKSDYSSAKFLTNVGIPTRINFEYAIMHSKYIIIDSLTVQTGSFNYSKAAENKNAENIIILRNQPNIAKQFENNWQTLWDESEDYEATY